MESHKYRFCWDYAPFWQTLSFVPPTRNVFELDASLLRDQLGPDLSLGAVAVSQWPSSIDGHIAMAHNGTPALQEDGPGGGGGGSDFAIGTLIGIFQTGRVQPGQHKWHCDHNDRAKSFLNLRWR